MPVALNTNQACDDYASLLGWDYDNGGWYRGLAWDRYASNAYRWEFLADGKVNQTVEIMPRSPTAVWAVHFVGCAATEIWSGEIPTSGLRSTANHHC